MLGGLLGGMLMGGLIGSLLFGGGFHGPTLIDLLLIGGGLFLLFRFLRSLQPSSWHRLAGCLRSRRSLD
jgi:predicted lipid-binding transport protein (Tim44 family)